MLVADPALIESIRPNDHTLGRITPLSEQTTAPYGPNDFSWLDSSYLPEVWVEAVPFDREKPPEGIEFLALLNEVEQLFPYYVKQVRGVKGVKGDALIRYVSNKIVGVQDRVATLFTKADPFEECENLRESLMLLFFAREIDVNPPVNGKSKVTGYEAISRYRAGEKAILPPNIVESLARKGSGEVTSIAP